MKFKVCACCGSKDSGVEVQMQLCKVCGWSWDPIQEEEPDMRGGDNNCSLNEAKAKWAKKRETMAK